MSKKSLSLRIFLRLLNVTSYVLPSLVIHWAYRRWFYSPRFPAPARELKWLASASAHTHEHPLGNIAWYRWGDESKPYVLLMHGWSGRASQMGAFAEPLLKAGYSVIAFDAPGHGRSAGRYTHIFQIVDVLRSLINEIGAPDAIIAHSFGCVVITYALAHGVTTNNVVFISSPTRASYLVERFFSSVRIRSALTPRFKRRFERDFGTDVWQRTDSDKIAGQINVPALIIHDRDDKEVSWQCSQWLADAWNGSQLLLTDGLGHRRILREEPILQQCVDFIARHRPALQQVV